MGLFHTAGKGTRLAPLPASENNNKPGVKLPVSVKTADGSAMPLSILESGECFLRDARTRCTWDGGALGGAPID